VFCLAVSLVAASSFSAMDSSVSWIIERVIRPCRTSSVRTTLKELNVPWAHWRPV
jgi:hypothetical protein